MCRSVWIFSSHSIKNMPDSVTQAIADGCFLLFRGPLIWCVHKLAVPCDSRLFKKSYNLGMSFNGSGDWQKVCVLSHLVIWQCWQMATQATESYSSSLSSSALLRPLHWPANRLLLHCCAQHTVAHMPLKTTSRVFWTKRNLLILMSQQDTAKWTSAVGW